MTGRRVKPIPRGATRISQDALQQRFQQSSMLADSLMEALGGMGTDKDKLYNSSFIARELDPQQALIAYRTDWVSRKIVDIPAYDACREWRSWQADEKDITKLEDTEEALGIQLKVLQAKKKARLFGGSALILGVNQGSNEDPLDYETIKQGDLQFVHAVSRYELGLEQMQLDIMDPYYGEPTFYTRAVAPVTVKNTGTKMDGLRFHPSRIVPFVGAELQEPNAPTTPWGDSVLQIVYDAVKASALVTQSAAQLIYEAKIDVIKVPGLSENIATQRYEDNLKARFAVANLVKSIYSMLLIDKEEEWNRQNATFAGIPDMLQMYMMIASGAADIPVTRFLGQAPAGLNATGESDTRNYYDSVRSQQKLDLTPRLKRLDAVLLPSALGATPDEIFYEWNPLWQKSDKEKTDEEKSKAEVVKLDYDMGLISPMVLKQARQNQLIESGFYPGLEGFIEEFDPDNEDPEAGATPQLGPDGQPLVPETDPETGLPLVANENTDPNAPPQQRKVQPKKAAVGDRVRSKHAGTFDSLRQRVADATPRTLYVHRKVLNAGAIRAWAKAQGFTSMLEDDDLHVTLAYSHEKLDWSKVGEPYGEDEAGNLRVKPGGPRMMEQFGEATVLVFSHTELQWRHANICHRGASWDHDDFNPHITISYKWDMAKPLDKVVPYQGEIILGPEVWQEIKEDQQVDNTNYPEQDL